jgi:hypothetical protein
MTDLTLSEFEPDLDERLDELLKEEASKMYGSTLFLAEGRKPTRDLSFFSWSLSIFNSLLYKVLQARDAHRA